MVPNSRINAASVLSSSPFHRPYVFPSKNDYLPKPQNAIYPNIVPVQNYPRRTIQLFLRIVSAPSAQNHRLLLKLKVCTTVSRAVVISSKAHWYTFTELTSQYASLNASGFAATYSSHVPTPVSVEQLVHCVQASPPASAPQKSVSK